MNKKITVIIPVYNTAEFLDDCLRSVLLQTYNNLEIIIVNDGSNQDCKEKIKDIISNDTRVIYIELSKQIGVGAARNLGLSKATGEYVYFLDSDDYLSITTLDILIDNIGSHHIIAGKIEEITVPADFTNGEIEKNVTIKRKQTTRIFKDMSILHTLVSLSYIEKHMLKFDEETSLFTELNFIIPLIDDIVEFPIIEESIYYKRTRNDPITNPALHDLPRVERVLNFLTAFNKLDTSSKQQAKSSQYLQMIFLNCFRKEIIMLLENTENIHLIFDSLSVASKKISTEALNKTNFIVKSQIKLLQKNKEGLFINLIKLHHTLRKTKYALGGRTRLYIQLYQSVFKKLPIKEKTIVFESFLGKNYSDSPKYIYEYMHKEHLDYQYVWIFNNPNRQIPGNAKQVKRMSLAYYYYLATSKYWVSNSRMPRTLTKREGNIYLQTWHGTPLKRLVFDMNDVYSANPNYKKHFYEQSRRWDYLISPNQYSSDIFKSAFKFDKIMLEFGYPRNDILYHENKTEIAQSLKAKLGIPLDKKVILYAPTWRDDEFYGAGKYKFNLKLDLQEMKKQLGDEYVIILRMHYFIADHIDTKGAEKFAYNLSSYDDIAELYLISDLLITDYSSVFFDYANLKRPILFFTYDLEKYRDTLRGFYIDVENEVPGPLLKTSDDVIASIKHIESIQQAYQNKYEAFYDKFCSWENGTASKQVVEEVFK